MKKLKLNMEELSVDTFELSDREQAKRGTVHANATRLCSAWASCQGSCPGTCQVDTCYSCSLDSYCETVQATCNGQNTCGYPNCV